VAARLRVLFGRDRFTAELRWQDLAPLLPGWEIACCPRDRLAEHAAGADAVCPFGAVVDQRVLAAGRFGLVHQFGVGLEKVDVAAATGLGVWVCRVPGEAGGNADSVAELAVLHLLALVKRLNAAQAALTGRRWEYRPAGGSLQGATVLIVGLGAVGTAVTRRLAGFGVRLLAVRARPELGGPDGVELVAGPDRLAGLLGQADAVVCCAMYHRGSAPMFGSAAFAAMKRGALLVNVARGGLVDEAALLAVLESGQLGGAGLDVHASEPADPDSALLRHPLVVATPHVGALTTQMFRRTGAAFAANLQRWAAGEEPDWAVNRPAFSRWPGPAART
jgi:phosphoglycerate dehydrogenase-like enzyme